MFNRAGEKIKLLASWATVLCWLYIGGSSIRNIYLAFKQIGTHFWTMESLQVFGGLVLQMIIGLFAVWVLGVMMYGFGEIVDSHEGRLDD